MKVLLRIQDLNFVDTKPKWWEQSNYLITIFKTIDKVGLWARFAYYGQEGKKLTPFNSINTLEQVSKTWKPGTYTIVTDEAKDPEGQLDLVLKVNALTIRFGFSDLFVANHDHNLLIQLIDIVCELNSIFNKDVLIGPLINVEIIGEPYPRIRPPRLHPIFTLGTVAMIISQKFHTEHRLGNLDEVKKILQAPLFSGMERIIDDDLIILRWAETLKDKRHIQESRTLQEKWLNKVLDLPYTSSYNHMGDYKVTSLGLQTDPILTFYHPTRRYGYKTTILYSDGTVDEDMFNQMASWIKQKQLPDGRPLVKLYLILPERNSTIKIQKRALEMGMAGVYYVDNKGDFWDPFPPGLWVESAISNQ